MAGKWTNLNLPAPIHYCWALQELIDLARRPLDWCNVSGR